MSALNELSKILFEFPDKYECTIANNVVDYAKKSWRFFSTGAWNLEDFERELYLDYEIFCRDVLNNTSTLTNYSLEIVQVQTLFNKFFIALDRIQTENKFSKTISLI